MPRANGPPQLLHWKGPPSLGRVAVVWMANVLPDPPVDCMGVVKYLADDWIGLRLGPLGRGFSRHLQSPSS